jgi:hypothetical protein
VKAKVTRAATALPHSGARAQRLARWYRPAMFGLSTLGLLLALWIAHIAASDQFARDAHAYWLADGYGRAVNTQDAFLYSPPILLIAQVLHQLPWPVFLELYSAAIAIGAWVLAGPFTLFVVFTPQVASEITLANIHIFLALVAVYGLRRPALWSFVLLTKVTPGIGLLWFVARGEWRSLAIAFGVTATIAVPTLILAPGLWVDWFQLLVSSTHDAPTGVPLLVRLPLAAGLVIVAARRDWPWLVPVGCMLALPVLWDVHGLSMLLGVLPYVRRLPAGARAG